MTWLLCSKCDRFVAETAVEVHQQLNHPKRHTGNLAALAKAQAVLAQRRLERRANAVRLDAAWAGEAR